MPTLGEQTLLNTTMCPSAHPQSAGTASVCNWRTPSKTAAPSRSCICHNCDLMEQSENAAPRFNWLFSHTRAIVFSLSLSTFCYFCHSDAERGNFSHVNQNACSYINLNIDSNRRSRFPPPSCILQSSGASKLVTGWKALTD